MPSVETIGANVAVFCGAVAAAVYGALQAVKKIKEGWTDAFKPPAPPPSSSTQAAIVGGLLQDAFSTPMAVEELRKLNANMERLTEATKHSADATCDQREETRELRHQVERLTDRLMQKGT